MFGSAPAWFDAAVAGSLGALVSFLFQFLKPLLEALPGLRPGSAAHDSTLRGLVFVLNLGGILGFAASGNTLDLHQWLAYALLAIGQTAASHLVYVNYTSGKVDAPVFGDPASDPGAGAAPQPVAAAAPIVAASTDPAPALATA